MKYSKKIWLSGFWCVVGAVLIALSFAGVVDEFWNGMGSGLFIVGLIQVIKQLRYRNNEEYREQVDIALDDERYKYIANKSWAWAGYLYVMIAAVGSIVLKICGQDELCTLASSSLALLVGLYWVSYMVLKRKY